MSAFAALGQIPVVALIVFPMPPAHLALLAFLLSQQKPSNWHGSHDFIEIFETDRSKYRPIARSETEGDFISHVRSGAVPFPAERGPCYVNT